MDNLNTGAMKSYELVNAPLTPASVTLVSQVAEKLLSMGFVIITAQFGDSPSITVKPTVATRQLASVCTGQCGVAGQMYKTYAGGIDGVKVIWYKPMRPLSVH